jgi:hypothetical protein
MKSNRKLTQYTKKITLKNRNVQTVRNTVQVYHQSILTAISVSALNVIESTNMTTETSAHPVSLRISKKRKKRLIKRG